MNHIKYQTKFRIVAPKLWGADLFCNITKETEKAYLLTDIVQDTDDGNGLMISERWMAKSQITGKENIVMKWSYDYDHLLNGRPALLKNHKEDV